MNELEPSKKLKQLFDEGFDYGLAVMMLEHGLEQDDVTPQSPSYDDNRFAVSLLDMLRIQQETMDSSGE